MGSSSVIDLHSPVNADTDEDNAAAATLYWTTARNPLLAMEAIAQEDGEDNDGEFSDALVQSAIAHRLKRNTSSRDLLFTPQQLEDLLGLLIENQRKLLEFAIRADSHRPLRAVQLAPQLGEALPVKLPKKLKNKEGMADRLAEIYFIWREVARCPQVLNSLPHVRTKLGSALEDFTLSLVCVHTFCRAELEVERNTTKALRSEKISGELFFVLAFCFDHSFVGNTSLDPFYLYQDTEMKLPWDTRGCYQRMGGKQFLVCTKCGHKYNDWLSKNNIEEKIKVLKWTFDTKIAESNEKMKHKTGGKGLKKPIVEQLPLLIRCTCHKHFHSGYSSTCPNQCGNGSCKLCNCLCSFVVSTTNYAMVRIASSGAQKPTKSNSDVDNAREFLKAGAKVRKLAAEDAAEAYEKMMDDGKLEYDDKELGSAISKQASFVTVQRYLETPPAHVVHAGLAAKISMLAYPKGPMWVHRNGVDVNLGGSGSKRRANNNGLTCIQEEEPKEIDNVVHVVRV